jgi:hypothetical protein
MQKKALWIIIGTLVIIGVGFTFWDYIQWRHEELDRYGQGWKDLEAPAMQLEQMYQSKLLGVRLRLPAGWKIEDEGRKIEVEGIMTVTITTSQEGLTDLVNSEVAKLKASGKELAWEREYVTTEKMDMTVITWQEELPGGRAQLKQRVMGKMRDKLIRLEVAVPEEEWGKYEKTFWEIYKNLEMT